MSDVDDYLATVDPERRPVLQHMVDLVREMLPGAEETTSYNLPTFKQGGKAVVGFHAVKNHMALFPFSGWVVESLKDDLEGYSLSSGTIRFTLERPLPDDLVRKVVHKRLEQIAAG